MRLEFWGTRGSISRPGRDTVRYGGNTSCVAVVARDGTRVVLDCGTGAYGLGQSWMASGKRIKAHLLIGHTHWDHIQGIPFFAPLFQEGNEFDVYAPRGVGPQIRDTLAGQMQYTYFPVRLEQLGATIRYHDLAEQTFQIGSITVTTRYLNHPAVTLGYRLEADGVTLVYATDHEPHGRPIGPGGVAQHRGLLHPEDRQHAAFLREADLVIHDSQYTLAEYPAKVGWGHSTIEYVLDVAIAAGARRLALFHHDPQRTDDALDALVGSARDTVRGRGSRLELFAAAEGQVVELVPAPRLPRRTPLHVALAGEPGDGDGSPEQEAPPPDAAGPTAPAPATAELADTAEVSARAPSRRIVVAVQDAALLEAIRDALGPEGFVIDQVADVARALELARETTPALLLLPRRDQSGCGIATTAQLRGQGSEPLRQLPVVMLARPEDTDDMEAGFSAGLTDWLTQPCSPAFVQSRLRSWLLRMKIRWLKPPLPPDEDERLEAVRATRLVGTPPEERFDRLARLAARSLGTQLAFVSLMERDRQWFKSCHGMELEEYPRDVSMCAYTLLNDDVLVVADAAADPTFGDNPAFHNELHLRFYAGIPLRGPGAHHVGSLCVYDPRPRALDPEDRAALRDLATLVEREIAAAPT